MRQRTWRSPLGRPSVKFRARRVAHCLLLNDIGISNIGILPVAVDKPSMLAAVNALDATGQRASNPQKINSVKNRDKATGTNVDKRSAR